MSREEPIGVTFQPAEDGAGLTVVDPIERHHYPLSTSAAVEPTAADPGRFEVPVDAAVEFETDGLSLPTVVPVYVRDDSGEMLAEVEHFASTSVPAGTYTIEICGPVKLYVRVTAPVTVTGEFAGMRLSFGSPTSVVLGARSHHDHPAATITTPDDPESVMAALSAFGSALKTTSPERSYPTLRGHPPLLELGDELDVPAGLEAPDTGVRIEVPPTFEYVYPAAPLSYYLGAELVPGEEARIVTDAGFEHALEGPGIDYETAVERVLKQTFFFDCVARTEGYYTVDLYERSAVEADVDIDFAAVYDRPLAEQLETYLSVPFDVVEPHLPGWKLTTHVAARAESAETLPFLVDDLAIVRTPTRRAGAVPAETRAVVDDFLRSDDFTRSASAASTTQPVVEPETAGSIEQAWVGDGAPVGASKATTGAYRNRLDRTPVEGDIDITVVCNDTRMDAERSVVDRVYGSHDMLPYNLTVHRDLGVDELAEVLASQTEFIHYIGHIDDDGFECADGTLDATALDEVGVDAFFLNACASYEQGMALLDHGAIAGIVTLTDVINSGAVTIGQTVARLLNAGFPLQAALEIARDESVVGHQYLVVGDSGLAIAQAESGTPMLYHLEETDGDAFRLRIDTFPTADRGMGSLITPYLATNEFYYLSSGELQSFEVTRDELLEFLGFEDLPVRTGDGLRWSTDLVADGA